MNPLKRPMNSPKTWQSLPKQGVNLGIFCDSEGLFRCNSRWGKDLQTYGWAGNSSLTPARTYAAKQRAPRRALSVSLCRARTSVDAHDFIGKSTVKQSITLW